MQNNQMIDNSLPTPIITLNWNGINDTLECISSVLEMKNKNFIWYIVDNGSTDNSKNILKKKYINHPNINLVFNEKNLGFTRGNNEVLKLILAQSKVPKYIALLNNDTVVEHDWLNNLIESAERNQSSMVSSKMIDYFDRLLIDNVGHFMLNTGEILPIGHKQSVDKFENSFENIGACAGGALYSSEMLLDIGIFDEYFDTGYEDAELGLRANILGYKTIYEPTAILYHKNGQSIKKVKNFDFLVKTQSNILYTQMKLVPTFLLLINFPFLLLRYLLVGIFELFRRDTNFMKALFSSYIRYIFPNILSIMYMRNSFYGKYSKRIIQRKLFSKQYSFFKHDFRRFRELVMKGYESDFSRFEKHTL